MDEGTADEEVPGATVEGGSPLRAVPGIDQPSEDALDFLAVVTRLRGVLGDARGKIRVSDVQALAGLEQPSYYRMSLIARALRHLGWKRSRYRFRGTVAYAYARGTRLQREALLEIECASDGQFVLKKELP